MFTALGPAAGAAGRWLLLSLLLAAVVATCNALSSADLAAVHPQAGGTYVGFLLCLVLAVVTSLTALSGTGRGGSVPGS